VNRSSRWAGLVFLLALTLPGLRAILLAPLTLTGPVALGVLPLTLTPLLRVT
jgi:hypothetical protein